MKYALSYRRQIFDGKYYCLDYLSQISEFEDEDCFILYLFNVRKHILKNINELKERMLLTTPFNDEFLKIQIVLEKYNWFVQYFNHTISRFQDEELKRKLMIAHDNPFISL